MSLLHAPGRPGDAEAQTRTAKAVIVLSVLRLIWAGINAKMKLGTLSNTKSRTCDSTCIRVYQKCANEKTYELM